MQSQRMYTYARSVIARQALAQEDNTDFGNDFPDIILPSTEGEKDGCAC